MRYMYVELWRLGAPEFIECVGDEDELVILLDDGGSVDDVELELHMRRIKNGTNEVSCADGAKCAEISTWC